MARLLALGLLLVASAIAWCADPWLNYRGNPYHTGYVDKWLNWFQFTPGWKTGGGSVSSVMECVAFNGLVFHTSFFGNSQSQILAVNETTGTIMWQHLPAYGAKFTQPVVWNGRLFYLRYYNNAPADEVVSVDATTGLMSVVATFEGGNHNGGQQAPVIVNGILYWVDSGGIHSYNVVTGLMRWEKRYIANEGQMGSPAISSNAAIFYGRDLDNLSKAYLYVVFAANGNLAFRIQDPNFTGGSLSGATPIVGKGGNVFIRASSRLSCFNVNSRQFRWSIPCGGPLPAVGNGRIYIKGDGTYVPMRCLDENSGVELWRWVTSGPHYIHADSFLLTNNILFVGGNDEVTAMNIHTRQPVWNYISGLIWNPSLAMTSKTLLITGQSQTHTFRVPSVQ